MCVCVCLRVCMSVGMYVFMTVYVDSGCVHVSVMLCYAILSYDVFLSQSVTW